MYIYGYDLVHTMFLRFQFFLDDNLCKLINTYH